MKIAICVNGRPHESGVTTYINTIADGFRQIGCDVRVVTIFGTSEYREIKRKFKDRSDKFLQGREEITRIVYSVSKVVLFIRLVQAYLFEKYDVIYANDVSVVNAAYHLSRLISVPIFLMAHYPINKDLISQGKIVEGGRIHSYFLREEAKGYRLADGILTHTKYVKEWIENLEPNHALIKLSPHAVDDAKFQVPVDKKQVRLRYGWSGDDLIVLFCGRLADRKGPEYPLRALSFLRKQQKDLFRLVYVGDGPERRNIERLVETEGLEDSVDFLGVIPHFEIIPLYQAADVVIIPSVTVAGVGDNAPAIAYEAMASGVPIVATPSGGLKELITHEYNGLLVPECDEKEMAAAICRLRDDSRLRQELIDNGLREVEEKYRPAKVAQDVLQFFLTVGKASLL